MSHRWSTRWAARLCLLLGVIVASPVALPAATAAPFTIEVELDRSAFSPNGDGHADVLAGDFYLLQRASVRLLVKNTDQRVAVLDLGVRSPHDSRFTWDGRDESGHRFADGGYGLKVVARASNGETWRSEWVYISLDTSVTPGTLAMDWPAVYPRSEVVSDSVSIRYLSPFDEGDWSTARGWVANRNGKVIAKLRADRAERVCLWQAKTYQCGLAWAWSGRRHGEPLAAGSYRVVVVGGDEAGNRARSRARVRVSSEKLQPVAQTVVVPAASSVYVPHYDPSCNGCGEDWTCGDVLAPGRFGDGSFSYRSADTCTGGMEAAARESHSLIFDPAPAIGDYRVTVYGGPTLPGALDQGALLVGGERVPTGADASDHETVSPWVRPSLAGFTDDEVVWTFETLGHDSYDAAWFRVELMTYRPLP